MDYYQVVRAVWHWKSAHCGEKIDLDAVGFTFASSGSMNQYPFLKKLSQSGLSRANRDYADEELEAEFILGEFDWLGERGSSSSPQQAQRSLDKQHNGLQMEIISYLLEWEEEPGTKASVSSTTPATSSLGMLPDSVGVLSALGHVDAELSEVEAWLGSQINALTSIQHKLSVVESESGFMQTTYHNLQRHAQPD